MVGRPAGYWWVAAVYFCGFGAMALVLPHLNQYLLGVGFSGVQVGNILAASSLVGLVVAPLASRVADRTGLHRRVLRLTLVVEGASLLGLGLRPGLLAVVLGTVGFRSSTGLDLALRDRLSLHWLGEHGSAAYGSLRLWGSVSFAVLALGGGLLAEWSGPELLFVLAALLILAMVGLARVYTQRLPTQAAALPGGLPDRRRGWPSPALVVILLTTFLIYLGLAHYFGWNYNFIEHELGGGKGAVGLFSFLAALFEVPVMLYADGLMRRRGAALALGVGMLVWAVSWVLFSLAGTPAQALLLTLPMGIAQGFALVAPTVYVGQISQPHNMAFNLSLMGVASSLGLMVGSPVAGWLFDNAGMRAMFLVAAGILLLGVAALAVGTRLARQRAVSAQPTA